MTNFLLRKQPRVIFITGTDTGVGKTLVTGLLLHHLRSRGTRALAIKPFCSGGISDIRLLGGLQEWELTSAEISPFYFAEAVSPLVAARKHRQRTTLSGAIESVRRIQDRCDCLLVEGVGGLLVPLGEGFHVLDLIASLECEVVVVARNRVGTINHTLLTVNSLRGAGIERMRIVVSAVRENDASSRTNARLLAELVAPLPVISIPFVGPNVTTVSRIKNSYTKLKKPLARVLDFDTFSVPFGKSVKAVSENSR